jgi:hypothetical protein
VLLNDKAIELEILTAILIMFEIIKILLNCRHKLIHFQRILEIEIKVKDRNNMASMLNIHMSNKCIELT